MASFKVAKQGFNAQTAGIQDLLIDSNYPTMLHFSSLQGSVNVPINTTVTITFPFPESYLPYAVYFTDKNGMQYTVAGKYYLQSNESNSLALQGWEPAYTPGTFTYNGWQYTYLGSGAAYSANYLVYMTYLQSDGAYNNTAAANLTPPYMNVSTSGVNAQTGLIREMAFTSAFTSVQIVNEASITLTGAGNGGVLEMSFAHNLGTVLPFLGSITNSTVYGSETLNFSTANLLYGAGGENYDFAIDATNFYLDINGSVLGQNYTTTLRVYFIDMPQ